MDTTLSGHQLFPTELKLTLYHTIKTCGKSILKILCEKEKMVVNNVFSLSQNAFYPIKHTVNVFSNIKFVICNWSNLDKAKILSPFSEVQIEDPFKLKALPTCL